MSDAVIKVENLGKKYVIGHQGERGKYMALRDEISEKASGLFNWSIVYSLKWKTVRGCLTEND